MDIKITGNRKPQYRIVKEFEYIDLIPYGLGLIMIIGYIILVRDFLHILSLKYV